MVIAEAVQSIDLMFVFMKRFLNKLITFFFRLLI